MPACNQGADVHSVPASLKLMVGLLGCARAHYAANLALAVAGRVRQINPWLR